MVCSRSLRDMGRLRYRYIRSVFAGQTGFGLTCHSGLGIGTMFVFFLVLKSLGVLRVTKVEELAGLDYFEHGEIEGG